jgi:flagellar basal body-associated protein FliL
MSKKKKIIIGVVILLLGGGYEAKAKLMPPPVVHMKIAGAIYVLPSPFTLDLSDGHYATLTVALELAPAQSAGVADTANPPPTGFGTLPEEPAVRAIITGLVTGDTEPDLISASGRRRLQHQILAAITKHTDVKVDAVMFTDLAVQ